VRGADDEYYDMIAQGAEKKRSDKAARYEALAKARKGERVVETEQVGPNGKRQITYQIQKNKGLTPHRKKEVRNPRVKKRMKFEEKQKKLRSVKAVYKGGEGPGGYQGELSGVRKVDWWRWYLKYNQRLLAVLSQRKERMQCVKCSLHPNGRVALPRLTMCSYLV